MKAVMNPRTPKTAKVEVSVSDARSVRNTLRYKLLCGDFFGSLTSGNIHNVQPESAAPTHCILQRPSPREVWP